MNQLLIFLAVLWFLLLSVVFYALFLHKDYVICTDYKTYIQIPYTILENKTNVCYKHNMSVVVGFYEGFFEKSDKLEVIE